MELRGKNVAVLVEKLYEDQELWYPVIRMREAGATVTLIGPKKQTYESKYGYPATADIAVEQARASDYDALIVPGGWAPDHMRRSPAMVALVRDVHKQGKPVASICHGGWMLASAGILRGVRVTGFFSIK